MSDKIQAARAKLETLRAKEPHVSEPPTNVEMSDWLRWKHRVKRREDCLAELMSRGRGIDYRIKPEPRRWVVSVEDLERYALRTTVSGMIEVVEVLDDGDLALV